MAQPPIFIGCKYLKVTVYDIESKLSIQNANVIIDKGTNNEMQGYTDKSGVIIFEYLPLKMIPLPRVLLVTKETYNNYNDFIPTLCPDTDVYISSVGYVPPKSSDCEQKNLDPISFIICKFNEIFNIR